MVHVISLGLTHRDSFPHLRRMAEQIRHRGPDDAGVKVFQDSSQAVSLGHRRLSIIDLSAAGHQPMANEDETIWIVFNGEIYNYLELRSELAGEYPFKTRTDTEVLLAAYLKWGSECLGRLIGMFAFVIWDDREQLAFGARDRFGVKPLHLHEPEEGGLWVASEIKAIHAAGARREPDSATWATYFNSGLYDHESRTFWRHVRRLPPGACFTWTARSGMRQRDWYDLATSVLSRETETRDESTVGEELLSLLEESVKFRFRSDVPVGAYLSGGLDSTITTALIRNFTDTPLKTFSVTFEDPEYDESAYQQEAVRFLRTDHQDVRCRAEDIAEAFPDVIWHTEKPVLRTAPAPLYLLSQLVRNSGYKVVVTGEGSDEVLGGYDIFKETKIRHFWQSQPDSKMRPTLLRRLYPYLQNIQNQPDAYRQAFFHIKVDRDLAPFFSHLPRWQLTAKLKMFFSDAIRAEIGEDNGYSKVRAQLPQRYASWDSFCQAQYLETKFLLPGYILSSQGDRVAMAHSVEGRFPFLDHRVVEFASRLPASLKMKVLNEKYLLKRCAAGLIPPSVAKRHKQPYRAPDALSSILATAPGVATVLRMRRSAGGYLAQAFRSAPTNEIVRDLEEAQAEAEVRCF
jgi:asparagine synthase (glutamine-hydrolysing)